MGGFFKKLGKIASGLGSAVLSAATGDWQGAGEAAVGAFGSLAEQEANRAEQKQDLAEARAWQTQQMQAQNAFNASEAQKSRDFNAEQALQAQQFNAEQALIGRQWQEKMLENQRAYDSPLAQRERMQSAGINPNSFGSSPLQASGGVSAPSVASGTPATGAPASAGSAPSTSTIMNPKLTSTFDFQKELINLDIQRSHRDQAKAQADLAKAEAAAKLRKLPSWENGYSTDGEDYNIHDEGNNHWVAEVTIPRLYDHYEEERGMHRVKFYGDRAEVEHKIDTFNLYRDLVENTKDMKKQELLRLMEDVREKTLNNTILEEEAALLKKYGISSRDGNWLTTFIRACLRNPDSLNNIVSALQTVISTTAKGMFTVDDAEDLFKRLFPVVHGASKGVQVSLPRLKK